MLVSERRYDTGSEATCYDVVSRFDNFIEDACREKQLNKQDVLAGVLEIFKRYLGIGHRLTNDLLSVYNDCLSGSLLKSDQSGVSPKDTLITLSKTITLFPGLVTSQGLIAGLARDDEEPKLGDVLAMIKGTNDPWLLRPVIASDHEEYTFLGGCRRLYGSAQYPEMNNWLIGDDEQEKTIKEFFASNEVREFHLV
jgi:hypothetical protein